MSSIHATLAVFSFAHAFSAVAASAASFAQSAAHVLDGWFVFG